MLVHTRILVTFVFLTYSMGFNVQTSGSSAPGFGCLGTDRVFGSRSPGLQGFRVLGGDRAVIS